MGALSTLTTLHIAAVHHGLLLLIQRSRTRIDELVASGNGGTEIAAYWRSQLADAQNAFEALGFGKP